MTKYNKAFVPILMGIIYLLNEKYGVSIPLSETEATMLVTLVTSTIVWLVPNRA